MDATIRMESIWSLLQSLSLSNREWLIDKLQHSVRMEKDAEYISKEEVLSGIRRGLEEVKSARLKGEEQKTLQELIDEL